MARPKGVEDKEGASNLLRYPDGHVLLVMKKIRSMEVQERVL
jgi:hypothetical protein